MNLYNSDYYPYLRDHFDLLNSTIQEEEIYTAKKFHNILGAYYRTSQNRVQKYRDCLQQIDQFLASNR